LAPTKSKEEAEMERINKNKNSKDNDKIVNLIEKLATAAADVSPAADISSSRTESSINSGDEAFLPNY